MCVNIMGLNGDKMINTLENQGKKIIVTLMAVYFFLGKLKLFTLAKVSTDYLFWAILFCGLLFFCIVGRKIKIKNSSRIFILYLVFELIEMFRGTDATPIMIFNILTILIYLYIRDTHDLEKWWFKLLYVGGGYYTVTVLLQALIPSLINKMRMILLSTTDYELSQKGYENTTNYMSGMAANSAVAAFFIAIFIAIAFAKLTNEQNNRFKNLLLVFGGLSALLLTQKRTLILAVVIAIVFVYAFFKKGISKKIRFFMVAGILFLVFAFFAIEFIPSAQILLNRFFHNKDLLSGRENYYDVMLQWYKSNPLLGAGIGKSNSTWGYGGHNSYIQLLGETGIIGCAIYACMVIPPILKIFKLLYRVWNDSYILDNYREDVEIVLATGIICIVILIYAITGNPFYDFTFCLAWFSILAVPSQVTVP